jgi:hypothetical protein
MFGMGKSYFLQYVSDLTFVRQNGTDITFSSDDKGITQEMSIIKGLDYKQGKESVFIHMITRSQATTWDVIAIEQLNS